MSHDAFSRTRGCGLPPLSFLSGTTNASFSTSGASSIPHGVETCSSISGDHSISLASPRPENQRSSNVYVDTPFQHVVPFQASSTTGSSRPAGASHHDLPSVHGTTPAARLPLAPPLQKQHHTFKKATQDRGEGSSQHLQKPPPENVFSKAAPKLPSGPPSIISQQPKTFKKRMPEEEESIICNRCGRCRCEACTTAKPPGGVWLFGGKCHCSPAEAVDFASCLCCVKGVLYHCGKDSSEDVPSVDRLCSCSSPNAPLTWVCLVAAAVPLPCLLCYWPLTWIRRLCEGTYLRFNSHGCRCNSSHVPSVPSRPQTPPSLPEKRLLQDFM